MEEKNVNQRLVITAIAVLIGIVLLYPPSRKLRPGLDIAGGTSLIFEIDTSGAENERDLAERVKTLLQKRVDPQGIYNLTWRVQGQNRIEVQMPLPPKDATARRETYSKALDELFSHELRRGSIEEAVRTQGETRTADLNKLARRNADAALAELKGPEADARRKAVEQDVSDRGALLLKAAGRFDAMVAADAARKRGPLPAESQPTTAPLVGPTTEPATTSAPVTQDALEEAYRDASELYEDSLDAVLATNLNRRRFQEVIELDAKSAVRKNSLAQIRSQYPDLLTKIDDVLAKHAAWSSGRRFLDGSADLKRLLRGSGKLEFRILAEPSSENVTKYDRYRKQLKEGRLRLPEDAEGWFKIDNALQFFNFDSPAQLQKFDYLHHDNYVVDKLGSDDYYVLAKRAPASGLLQGEKGQRQWKLIRARPDHDGNGRPCVRFTLDVVGGQQFYNLTSNNIKKALCILVDDVAYSAPNIQSAIRADGVITGDFSQEKIRYLVQTMEGGMLPARLKDTPLSERTIGSSLGEANRDMAVRAGLIGTIAIVSLMLVYYMVCGMVANVAMLLNVLLTLAALAMLGARITLDGIAGLILSVGMAVDANVLIYERMREEKERGSSLRMIIKNGYDRAFSTIFDSNMTTLLTCLIIYYAGSEEVKGFGLTLGWGIALNLFTAVFVTRAFFGVLLKYNLIKDVKMLKLIGVPKINWYGLSKYLVPATAFVALFGVSLLFFRGSRNVFDIEFLGGTAAEVEFKPPGLDDVAIRKELAKVGASIAEDAGRLEQVSVEPVAGEPDTYAVRVPGVEPARLVAMFSEPLEPVLQRGGIMPRAGTDQLALRVQPDVTQQALTDKIRRLNQPEANEARDLINANVNAVLEVGGVAQKGLSWNITTTATNMRLVEHALKVAFGDKMNVQPTVTFTFRGVGDKPYPITDRLLDAVVPGLPAGVNPDVTDYTGGAAYSLEQVDPPLSIAALKKRLDNMHFQPDFQDMPVWRCDVIGITPAAGRKDEQNEPLYSSVVVVAADPDIRYGDNPETWWTNFAQGELRLIRTALTKEQSLAKVMQFKPQIAAAATQQAFVALVLSWGMIIAYVWIRFGRAAYGVGGVVALIHDVLLAIGFVGFSGWLGATVIGQTLLVSDFKINMPIVAALLTIVGYSINDTIVIFDRIRENRGRLGIVTPQVINDAINQTLSRTIMTVFTVFIVIVIAYIFGGSSIRGFNYCMLIGVLTGCYSSIAIASPLLLFHLHFRKGAKAARG